MYYCDRNKTCKVTVGYYYFGNYWYKCDNIKCEKDEFSKERGEKGNPKYYYVKGINDFPGAENSESILIEVGENYAVVFKGEGYYLIN